MCVDFIDLNKAFPKDPYPLPHIDRLIDTMSEFYMLIFMDAYSGYNQIRMNLTDASKIAFMTDINNSYYKVMPFGLKNVGAMYKRLLDMVFSLQIGRNLEVYVEDMLLKTQEEVKHVDDLK